MEPKTPAAVVFPDTGAQVQAAVLCATKHGAHPVPRSGGCAAAQRAAPALPLVSRRCWRRPWVVRPPLRDRACGAPWVVARRSAARPGPMHAELRTNTSNMPLQIPDAPAS
jgi:hypothetical protein